MNAKKKFFILATMLAFFTTLPAARASEKDQAVKLTFNQPIRIPGHVLPAGTYWFKLVGDNPILNTVQVFNADRFTLYATFLTVNTERRGLIGDLEITFADRGAARPESIVSWFFPGNNFGHEFVYSNSEQQELAQVKRHTLMVATAGNKRSIQIAAAGD